SRHWFPNAAWPIVDPGCSGRHRRRAPVRRSRTRCPPCLWTPAAPAAARPAASRCNSGLLEQRPHVGLAPAKPNERVHGIDAAASAKDGLAKARSGLGVENAGFLESFESICGKHFGPFVAVVRSEE